MYVFREKMRIDNPISVVFLCGSSFSESNERDKRRILQEYIKCKVPNCFPIILEQNFRFRKPTTKYLAYDDIFLKGLAQIEQLTSLYADKILIIHESNSTAAELGAFVINETLAKKICVLAPDAYAVEDDKISNFIFLSFVSNDAAECKVKLIRYYPDTEIHRNSCNKSDYYCYFHEDQIGPHLSEQLNLFLDSNSKSLCLSFQPMLYGKCGKNERNIEYKIDNESKEVFVSVSPFALKYQLMALLFVKHISTSIRKEKLIKDHVNYLENEYCSILKDTISHIAGQKLQDFAIKVELKESTSTLRQAIGYCLYLLQAAQQINLEQKTDGNLSVRKVSFKKDFNKRRSMVGSMIERTNTTEFGRQGL